MTSGTAYWHVTRTRPFREPPAEKCCRDCGITKPRVDFHKSRGSRDGLKSWCIECAAASEKERLARIRMLTAARDED